MLGHLLKALVVVSDPFGKEACHYDLSFDLDGLWTEAMAVLEAANPNEHTAAGDLENP